MASRLSALGSSPTGRVSLRCPRPSACSLAVTLPTSLVESKSFYLVGSVGLLTGHFRTALCGAIVILLGGSIAEITASGWKSWLGAAVLVRAGVGLAQSILVTYVSELAPFQIRGLMIGAYQLCLGIGQLISAIATQLITIHQPTKWRPLIATEFIFTGVCTYHPILC
jgi:MFS family permease